MKQKRKFGGILCLMLLGVFAMSSCVQDDMYELYDDGFENGFVRKKKSKDYGNWPASSGINYSTSGANIPNSIPPEEFERQWKINMVNCNPNPFPYECFSYTLSNYGNCSLLEMRQKIGKEVFKNEPIWQLAYYDCVVNQGGLPTIYDDGVHEWYEYEEQLIKDNVGADRMEDDEWEEFYRCNRGKPDVSDEKIIVMVEDEDGKSHAGILKKISGDNRIYLTDQYSLDIYKGKGKDFFQKRQVKMCYRKSKRR